MSYNVAPILFDSDISAVTATASTELGSSRQIGDKSYVYIYNGGATAIGTFRPVTILTAAVGMNTCSVSTTAGHMIRGFSTVSIPAANFGWILTKGTTTISISSNQSSLDLGAQQVGLDGLVKTLTTGGYPIGQLNTVVVSGNTGLLWVNLP